MKPWYKSKTIWYAIGIGATTIATEMAPVADLLPEDQASTVRTLLAVIMMAGITIIRFVTHEEITLTAQGEKK